MIITREFARAIATTERHVEIRANAGSGKTELLILRTQHLISQGVKPQAIHILSYSKAAVTNLSHRLQQVNFGGKVRVSTTHAFALSLVNRNLEIAGLPEVPKLISDKEQDKLMGLAVANVLKHVDAQLVTARGITLKALQSGRQWLEPQRLAPGRRALLQLFVYAQAANRTLSQIAAEPRAWFAPHIYVTDLVRAEYLVLKARFRSTDFGDFISIAQRVLSAAAGTHDTSVGGTGDDGAVGIGGNGALGSNGPGVSAVIPDSGPTNIRGLRISHLLVDEYQDLSPAIAQLLRLIANYVPHIMVVGDPYQAIFGFAGATYQPLRSLLPDVQELKLTRSFRVPQFHGNFVQQLVIANAGLRDADGPMSGTADSFEFRGHGRGTPPTLIYAQDPSDQARIVVERIRLLLDHGAAPESIVVLGRLRQHLRPVEAALRSRRVKVARLGQDPQLSHVMSVLDLVRIMHERIQPEDIEHLLGHLNPKGDRLAEAAARLRLGCRSHSLESRYEAAVSAYLYANGGVRVDRELRANLNAWAPVCRSYAHPQDLQRVLRAVDARKPVGTSTIHQAKGLGWKHVFVINCTTGLLPDRRALGPALLAEELNLMYVACTRARSSLTLVHAPQTVSVRHRAPFTAASLCQFIDHQQVRRQLDVRGGPVEILEGFSDVKTR
jgi:superfamily I DNA/RNA helicase